MARATVGASGSHAVSDIGVSTMRKETKGKAKIHKTMGEFKRGTLHSGSKKGPKVTKRKQAVAIALSQARREKRLEGKPV
jgi:hypothetical protein